MVRGAGVDGLLLADKPAGVTSHDVVLAARRAYGERRIGHAGTLDPFATGLLVLLLGRATRLLPHLDGEPKVYRATIAFGRETTTDDLAGETVREAAPPSPEQVAEAIPRLTGRISQVPPAYSAKRVGGVRAYAAARAGEALDLAPVEVTVHAWRNLEWRGELLDCEIECGGGTYVRALARDLGRLVGSAAHLSALRRIRSGPFDVTDASPLDEIVAGRAPVRAPAAALSHLPVQRLAESEIGMIVRGQPVAATESGARAALLDARTGALVALGERRDERWQPRVVMRKAT